MTRAEYVRFLAAYWVYTIVWVVLAICIALIPNMPAILRWGLAFFLALGTPAGGQFTSYHAYLAWWRNHVVIDASPPASPEED